MQHDLQDVYNIWYYKIENAFLYQEWNLVIASVQIPIFKSRFDGIYNSIFFKCRCIWKQNQIIHIL